MPNGARGLDIRFLKGVGPRRAALLERLGIRTVGDALFHLPFRYEDRRDMRRIRDLSPGLNATVEGTVVGVEVLARGGEGRLFPGGRQGGLSICELTVTDGTGMLKAKWFNKPYMKNRFRQGGRVVLSGQVRRTPWGIEIDNPEFEALDKDDAGEAADLARLLPVYPTTEGLSQRQIRGVIETALAAALDSVEDPVPAEVLARGGFPSRKDSLLACHMPAPDADAHALNAWRTPAQQRLCFEELFMLELGFAVLRKNVVREPGISFACEGRLMAGLRKLLPFSLTPAQERVIGEIAADMASPHPMNRLLQGDVGSGKTVVALAAVLRAAECGYQSALMAPTELLAEQHYQGLRGMLEALGLRAALLTGSVRDRPLEAIARGEADLVLGTHALFQADIRYKRLGLVVIDEQHRFGVLQRAELRRKAGAERPDVLVMTATPIPRTLALTLYGDLDCSVIDSLPPGRTPVRTLLFHEDRKAEIYALMEREVRDGGQAYVVYPAIEDSEWLKTATDGAEALGRMFPAMRIGLVHGRLRAAEREEIMAGFKRGEMDILVSTTVIEVGVDVPNASLMLVVHAERFGLAQLHQLRGRVGRGRRRSTCLLLAYRPVGEEAARRLDVMVRTTDGFRVAEADLEIRGPGEMLGTRQSGLPNLRVADIVRDAALLEAARGEAFALVARDPELRGEPVLKGALEGFWRGRVELFSTG